MKKMYAVYDKVIYELTEPAINDFDIININQSFGSLTNQMRVEESERTSEVNVKLNLGLIHDDFKTNKEVAEDVLDYAEKIKLRKCAKLDSNFTIELYYQLIDREINKVCDEGVLIRHDNNPNSHNKFRILGVTNDNELHYRPVKNITSHFGINYVNDIPCGIMRKKTTTYELRIEKIKIYQDFYDNNDYRSLEDRTKIHHKCSEGVAIPHSAIHYHNHHNDKLCIFNSKAEGFDFSSVFINMNLRRITIDFDLILNNYFILYDDNELDRILIKNNVYFKLSKPSCDCKHHDNSELFKDPLDRQKDEPQVVTWNDIPCFFANGSPIAIKERNDGKDGALILWENGKLLVDRNAMIFGGRHDDDTLTSTNIQVYGGCVNSIYGGGLHKSHTSVSVVSVHSGTISNVYGGGCQGIIEECDCEFKSFNDEDIKKSPNITDNARVEINGGEFNLVYGGGLGYSYTKKANISVNGDSKIKYLTAGGANGITTLGKIIIGNKIVKPNTQPSIEIVQGINRGTMDNIEIDVRASKIIEKLFCGGEIPFIGSKENPNLDDPSGMFKHSVVTINKLYSNIKELSLGGNDYEEIQEENDCVTIIEV